MAFSKNIWRLHKRPHKITWKTQKRASHPFTVIFLINQFIFTCTPAINIFSTFFHASSDTNKLLLWLNFRPLTTWNYKTILHFMVLAKWISHVLTVFFLSICTWCMLYNWTLFIYFQFILSETLLDTTLRLVMKCSLW